MGRYFTSAVWYGNRFHRVYSYGEMIDQGTHSASTNCGLYRTAIADLPTVSPDTLPDAAKCKNCWGLQSVGNGNAVTIPVSAISDPVIRARIEKRLKNRSQYRWRVVLDDAK